MLDTVLNSHLVALVVGKKGDQRVMANLEAEIRDMASDLAGPQPTAIERVLAGVVATNSFTVRTFEALYASATNGEYRLVVSEHDQKRIDRAHRRLLSSLKLLADVRRIAFPALQLNVARPKVNRGNPGSAGGGLERMNGALPLPGCPIGIDGLVERNGASHAGGE